eukprot:gene9679-biopygen3238
MGLHGTFHSSSTAVPLHSTAVPLQFHGTGRGGTPPPVLALGRTQRTQRWHWIIRFLFMYCSPSHPHTSGAWAALRPPRQEPGGRVGRVSDAFLTRPIGRVKNASKTRHNVYDHHVAYFPGAANQGFVAVAERVCRQSARAVGPPANAWACPVQWRRAPRTLPCVGVHGANSEPCPARTRPTVDWGSQSGRRPDVGRARPARYNSTERTQTGRGQHRAFEKRICFPPAGVLTRPARSCSYRSWFLRSKLSSTSSWLSGWPGGNDCARVRLAYVSLNAIVRSASVPRLFLPVPNGGSACCARARARARGCVCVQCVSAPLCCGPPPTGPMCLCTDVTLPPLDPAEACAKTVGTVPLPAAAEAPRMARGL